MSSDPRDRWAAHRFSISNPEGAGQGDPSALMKRAASAIDDLGDVWVQDIVYGKEQTPSEERLTVTVYYLREPRPS